MSWYYMKIQFFLRSAAFSTLVGTVGCLGNNGTLPKTLVENDEPIDLPALPPVPTQIESIDKCVQPGTPGPRLLRRLTNQQLHRSLQQVFADKDVPDNKPLNDATVMGFLGDASFLLVSDQSAQALMDNAESVASYAKDKIMATLPCNQKDAACYQQIADKLSLQLFHGPIPKERLAAYVGLAGQEADVAGGVEVLIQAMLQSPYFVYRREIGTPSGNGRSKLTSYEVADLIAYSMTDSMPDEALQKAAADNALGTVEQVKPHVARMLATPEGQGKFLTFLEQWLEVDKIKTAAKDQQMAPFDDKLRTEMLTESQTLIKNVTLTDKGVVTDLFNAPYTYLNKSLAKHYQLDSLVQEDDFKQVMLPMEKEQSRPRGILGHGSVLASHAMSNRSSPVQRGLWVRRRILCEQVPPPPSGLATSLKEEDANNGQIKTTRQLFEISHMQLGASCKSCHEKIDPIGFLFEGFDAFGRKRTQENGVMVDTSGALILPDDSQIPLADAFALSEHLGEEKSIEPCMIRYMMYSSFGKMSWPQNGCTLDAVQQTIGSNGSLLDIATAMFLTPHIVERTME